MYLKGWGTDYWLYPITWWPIRILLKQRLNLADLHGYSVVQTSLRASDSSKWNVSHIGCHHTFEHSCWTEPCSEKRLIERIRICLRTYQPFVLDCKVAKSSPFHFKKTCNWLYFNNFKELIIHFYGTLVICKIKIFYLLTW